MLQAKRQGPNYWYEDYPNAITDEDACEMVASDFPMATVIDVEVRNADNHDDVREYRMTRQVTFLVEAAV